MNIYLNLRKFFFQIFIFLVINKNHIDNFERKQMHLNHI